MQHDEPSDDAGSKRSILGRRADQKGVTLQEVLIGIAVAAALAAATIVIGVQFIGRGQSSAARQTLQSASLAVEANYARIVPGGRQNWTGATMAPTANSDALTRAAVIAFNSLGESFTFVGAVTTASGLAEIDAINEINGLDQNVVWVKVLTGYVIKAGNVSTNTAATVTITSGKVLILGIRGADGSTMCVINAKDSAPNLISGKGWQAVNEESSTATNTTVGDAAADCGAFKVHASGSTGSSTEWPRTAQTDTSLGDAKNSSSPNYS